MVELLEQMNHWHWLAFGLLLLAAELLGTAGYFLWLGISAILVGLIFSILPMSWQLQWVSFGVFSLITTWLWWRRQFKQDKKSDQQRELNQREKQLIGMTTRLEEDVQAGDCRIKLGDTTWSARCDQDISKGTQIRVIDVDGIILFIEPI
ncbi:NfeD family protein [Vibrio genomosp. F6]|uniref:NfeD family protein n=1 Tax=Vibrio TaxID=662 RepID=UPI0010BDF18C|nr:MULTISPECIES: NfeD family protein [Vibrio]NOH83419.1 NfeD family protein [Vibrio sp. 03-59-1]TKF23938.1 NfeD family protein [Vibrio genomosp. F6]